MFDKTTELPGRNREQFGTKEGAGRNSPLRRRAAFNTNGQLCGNLANPSLCLLPSNAELSSVPDLPVQRIAYRFSNLHSLTYLIVEPPSHPLQIQFNLTTGSSRESLDCARLPAAEPQEPLQPAIRNLIIRLLRAETKRDALSVHD